MTALIKSLRTSSSPRYIPLVAGVEFVRSALMLVLLPWFGVHFLGLSMAVVGIAISAHYLFDNALRPFFGYLADAIGAKVLLSGGLLISGAAMVLMVASRSPVALVVATALFGIGTSSLWPVVISRLTREIEEGQRAKSLSTVYAAWMIASGCGTVFATVLGRSSLAVALPLLTAVILASGAYALVIKMEGMGAVSFHFSRIMQNWGQDWRTLFVHLQASKWLFPGMYVQTLAIGLLIPVFSPYAKIVLHDRPIEVTIAMLLVGGAAVSTLPLFGRLVDRLGSRPFLISGYLGAGISVAFFTLQTRFWEAMMALLFAGVFYAMILPAWNSVLDQAVSEEWRAAMWGFFMMVEGLGTATGPLLSGELWVVGGPHAPFWGTAIIVTLMAVLYALLRHPALVRR